MKQLSKRTVTLIAALCLMTIGLTLAGCGGGGGGVSSQVVSGVASVGAPLSGQVNLKDASTGKEKVAVIGGDGSYAFDVTGMKGPFVLQAVGTAAGTKHTLHSFADGPGTANVNPLSNVAVASAAGVDNPEDVYTKQDEDTAKKISSELPTTVSELVAKLRPLLKLYGADGKDPIRDHYEANHSGLDGMFDNVNITVSNGIITIVNAKTGAVIFTGKLSDIRNWHFSDDDTLPQPPALPVSPAGLQAVGGANQVAITWNAVSNASSYNIYFATTSGVTTTTGTKIANATTPYVQSGLAAGTTYYYIVTAVNSAGESPASAQVSATTSATPPPVPTLPAAPTGVSATGGTNQATVSWSAVSGATSYNLYWSTTTGVTKANGTKISNVTSPAVHSGLSAGTTYYYIVTAVNGAGEGAPSVQVAATTVTPNPTPTVPAAPTGLTGTGGTNQATVSWSAVSGATSYNIYWATTTGVTKANGAKISGATSPYVHTGLSAGTTYYYIVTAVNSAGESAASSQVSATTAPAPPALPSAPTGVTATGGSNQVSLSWSAVSGATSYNVYWSTATGVTKATGTKIAGATSPYVQTGLAAGTTYYYIVAAVNSAGEGAASTQVSAATNAPAPVVPAAPTGVTATGGANQVTVSWAAVTAATSYNIYWSTTTGVTKTTGTKITGATSPYAHTGLAAGTAYYYVVTAVNSAGEGAASAQATATTNAPALVCGTCHAIPPATGQHAFHVGSLSFSCAVCHGTGYSSTTVNSATHMNGVKELVSSVGWNATGRTCSNSCHGSRAW